MIDDYSSEVNETYIPGKISPKSVYSIREYKKILGLNTLGDIRMRDHLEKQNLCDWSTHDRIIINGGDMKYNFTHDKINNSTVCFNVTMGETSCIYGYLHCEGATPKYICAGPTFRSQDGEYRRNMLQWKQFNEVYTEYAGDFALVEEYIIEKMTTNKLSFHVDYYLRSGIDQHDIREVIDNNRLAIKLYVCCWAVDFHNIYTKIMENHLHPAYQNIIYQLDSLPIYEDIRDYRKDSDPNRIKFLIRRLTQYYEHPRIFYEYRLTLLAVGQKIIPMTAMELIKIGDINFPVWREIFITSQVSNLLLNLISPSFSMINNWFYIHNSNAGLFDNLAMHEKYEHSVLASDISAQLITVDRANYVDKTHDKGPISEKFSQVSNMIHKSIIKNESSIKLTDVCICVTSEFVGRTLRDFPQLAAYNAVNPLLSYIFTDPGIFAKHIFEFIYAFYCMNIKLGVIHGDLHMNNATFFSLHELATNGKWNELNTHIAYIVGQSVYTFRHVGIFSMLIDFSRGIIGDYATIETRFSTRYADMYFREQRQRVMQVLGRYFPKTTAKYAAKIEALVISNFALMFKILTILDTYVVCSNLKAMILVDEIFTKNVITVNPQIIPFLDKIIQYSEDLMVKNITAAVEDKIRIPEEIEWPNLLAIRDHFSKYLLDPETPRDENIVDIFNSNNSVVYDIENYDTWGPILQGSYPAEIIKEQDEFTKSITDPAELKFVREVTREPLEHLDDTQPLEQLVETYREKEQEYLQFDEWMFY